MTKAIRIENADNSNHKIKVTVMARAANGPDSVVREINLSTPTQMETLYVWKGQYLIIEEIE